MILSDKAQLLYARITPDIKLGDLRNCAKTIKKDHDLAMELWSTLNFHARLLAILILDVKRLDADSVERMFADMRHCGFDEALQLADWLLANQLSKNKATVSLLEKWENDRCALKRRTFWYHQGRLRWVGQKPPANTERLLDSIERDIAGEVAEVQWAMNFTAAWIGIFDVSFRDRCIRIGEDIGIYRDEVVSKGCSPNFLPKRIAQEVAKRGL